MGLQIKAHAKNVQLRCTTYVMRDYVQCFGTLLPTYVPKYVHSPLCLLVQLIIPNPSRFVQDANQNLHQQPPLSSSADVLYTFWYHSSTKKKIDSYHYYSKLYCSHFDDDSLRRSINISLLLEAITVQ